MMKTNLRKSLLVLLTVVSVLSSCTKETRVERNLWKKGGRWNVDYFLIEQPSSDEVYFDCGVFSFDKNGTGKYILNTNSDVIVQEFDYTVLPSGYKYELSLIHTILDTAKYDIKWVKNKIELTRTEDETRETIYLSKDF